MSPHTVPAAAATSARAAPFRVCVVTAPGLRPGRTHADIAAAAVAGGADAVQVRAPELAAPALLALTRALLEHCRPRGVLLLVNNRPDVAASAGADGAHVGQRDDPAGARARLGPARLLGVSVGTPDEARAAARAGADYLGVTVWATASKPDAVPVGLDGLHAIAAATPLPVVAIGGNTPQSAPRALAAGARAVAVVSWVAGASDPVAATRELVAASDAWRREPT